MRRRPERAGVARLHGRASLRATSGTSPGERLFIRNRERRLAMQDEMAIDDAVNIANVLNDSLACYADEDVRELAIAAKRLVSHVVVQSLEIERERARRQALAPQDVRLLEGYRLEEGTDSGGRRGLLG